MYRDKSAWGTKNPTLNVNELLSHFRASGGSLVPDTLMELRDMALLKKCLNDGGTSFPFLHQSKKEKDDLKYNILPTFHLAFYTLSLNTLVPLVDLKFRPALSF